MRTMKFVLFFISVLAVWKLYELFFPEKTVLGKRLVKKIIELRLVKAFYKEFLYDIIVKDGYAQKSVDDWVKKEYESWLTKKAETGELSDIIKTKE